MCCSKGLLKRFVPFFAAFALGLLVASFFVSVAAPSFRFGSGFRHREYDRQMQFENQRLREENFRLRQQQTADNNIQQKTDFGGDINELVPPPPPLPPVAPAAPRRVR